MRFSAPANPIFFFFRICEYKASQASSLKVRRRMTHAACDMLYEIITNSCQK